jgi:hypothetical protein
VGRDQVNDSRYDREWQHQLDREAIEDQRYQQEWDYQVQQDALARAAREVRSRRSGGEDYEEEDRDKEASGEETDVPVDLNSVIQLGYGPVSDEYLLQLEAEGAIESYVEDGKRKFRKKEGGRSGGFVIPGLDSMLGVR